jgi:hypothetical protein
MTLTILICDLAVADAAAQALAFSSSPAKKMPSAKRNVEVKDMGNYVYYSYRKAFVAYFLSPLGQKLWRLAGRPADT